MTSHTIAEAEHCLSDLIDRALAGDAVVITRDGRPVVTIAPVALTAPLRQPSGPLSEDDMAWLDRIRVGTVVPGENAGSIVSRMRDEDWR